MAPLASAAAQAAQRIDPKDSEALVVLATLTKNRFDWQGAMQLIDAAATAAPNNSMALQRHAKILLSLGYLRRELEQIEKGASFSVARSTAQSLRRRLQ